MPLAATDAGRACNWLHVLVSIPPITQASIAEAELGINQVTYCCSALAKASSRYLGSRSEVLLNSKMKRDFLSRFMATKSKRPAHAPCSAIYALHLSHHVIRSP